MPARDQWNQADLDKALGALGMHDASRERVDRIRNRSLRALAAKARRRQSRADAWRQLEPAAALAAGASYMAIVLLQALALYR